jgi:hypothetical protein
MRKSLLILFIFPFFALNAQQKIEESRIDAFTGKLVAYTNWSPFFEGEGAIGQMASEVRFRYEHDRDFMQIKIVTGDVELTAREGAKVEFKTNKGEVLTFLNLRTETSGRGKGLQGGRSPQLGLTLQVTGDFDDFLDSRVEKIRYHFTDGYYDIDVPVKYQRVFRDSYELIVREVMKNEDKK